MSVENSPSPPRRLGAAIPSTASRGSAPCWGSASPPSHLPATCQVPWITHATIEPVPGTESPGPAAACCASVSPRGRFLSGRTFASRPRQSRPPCRLAWDTRGRWERNVLSAFPHCRPGQPGSINTPRFRSAARTAKSSPGSPRGDQHRSPRPCPPPGTAPHPSTLTPDPRRDCFQP